MPYYIYKIANFPIRKLEKLAQHAAFRDASASAKALRASLASAGESSIKVILADNELHAEDLLSRQRPPQPNPDDD